MSRPPDVDSASASRPLDPATDPFERGLGRTFDLASWGHLPKLAAQVGFLEILLADPRVAVCFAGWTSRFDPSDRWELRSELALGEGRARVLGPEAEAFVRRLGLPAAWLAEELLLDFGQQMRCAIDPTLDLERCRQSRFEGLLDEQRRGPTAAVDHLMPEFAFRLRRGETFGDALRRFNRERKRSAVDVAAFGYWLAGEARHDRKAVALETPTSITVEAWRRAGRIYYLAEIRDPPLLRVEIARQEWGQAAAYANPDLPAGDRRHLIVMRDRDVRSWLQRVRPLLED